MGLGEGENEGDPLVAMLVGRWPTDCGGLIIRGSAIAMTRSVVRCYGDSGVLRAWRAVCIMLTVTHTFPLTLRGRDVGCLPRELPRLQSNHVINILSQSPGTSVSITGQYTRMNYMLNVNASAYYNNVYFTKYSNKC